jgi:hypothetical protein
MVGISSQCVEWISHSNYTFLRRAGFNVKNAQLMLFQNYGEKNVQITPINLHYEAAFLSSRPAFLNLRIKQTILELFFLVF